jgi:hypothetical protein
MKAPFFFDLCYTRNWKTFFNFFFVPWFLPFLLQQSFSIFSRGHCQTPNKILQYGIMKLDVFHCALLVAIVLLAVYAFGSFREGNTRETFDITKACRIWCGGSEGCQGCCVTEGIPQQFESLRSQCGGGDILGMS